MTGSGDEGWPYHVYCGRRHNFNRNTVARAKRRRLRLGNKKIPRVNLLIDPKT
jgi:hypothetical protein